MTRPKHTVRLRDRDYEVLSHSRRALLHGDSMRRMQEETPDVEICGKMPFGADFAHGSPR